MQSKYASLLCSTLGVQAGGVGEHAGRGPAAPAGDWHAASGS